MLSLIQTSDLMSNSLEKSDNTLAVDRFLGQNYVHSPQYHGQIVGYFKPAQLTLFHLVLFGHWKGMLVNLIDEEKASKVSDVRGHPIPPWLLSVNMSQMEAFPSTTFL